MEKKELEKRRFPIGKYNPGDDITADDVEQWVKDIQDLPKIYKKLLKGVTEEQLDNKYREGSWSLRQVVHHVADSHVNAYIRMKRTLTEDVPTIFPYDEKEWAMLDDIKAVPISESLSILEGIHLRLYHTIQDLSLKELTREFKHMDMDGPESMAYLIGMYSWHGRHHAEHIKLAINDPVV